jgi:hypothetical protein
MKGNTKKTEQMTVNKFLNSRLAIVCAHMMQDFKQLAVMYQLEPIHETDSGLVFYCQTCGHLNGTTPKKELLRPVCVEHLLETPIEAVIRVSSDSRASLIRFNK